MSVIRGEALKGHLDLILLTVLERGPAYGYSIISEIERDTGGELVIADGTIYPALHRLERARLLTSFSEVTAGRRRRIYSLTPQGQDEAGRLKSDWKTFSRTIQRVLDATAGRTELSRGKRGA